MWRGTVRMWRRDCEAMDEEGTVGKGTVGRQMQSGEMGVEKGLRKWTRGKNWGN